MVNETNGCIFTISRLTAFTCPMPVHWTHFLLAPVYLLIVLSVRACCGPISLPLNVWNIFLLPEFLAHVSQCTQFLVDITRSKDPAVFSGTPLTPDKKFAIKKLNSVDHWFLLLNTSFSLIFWGFTMVSIHVFLQFSRILRSWCQTLTPLFSAFPPPGTPK